MDQNNKYDTVLFDWDGTIAQTIEIWERAFRDVFDSLHMNININQITEKLWLDSAILNDLGIEHSGFFDLVYEKLSQNFGKAPLYSGVEDVLNKLKLENIKLALVTSTRRKTVLPSIAYHHLNLYFPVIVASEDVSNHKPAAEPYELALTQLGSNKKNALIVGDSKFDILGSQNAEVDCALFLPKENEKHYQREELIQYKPKYVINSLLQILDFFSFNNF